MNDIPSIQGVNLFFKPFKNFFAHALKNKAQLGFVHFMILYLIYKLFQEFWQNHFKFELDMYQYWFDFLKNPLTYIPWLILGTALFYLVLFQTDLIKILIKTFRQCVVDYLKNTPKFLLSAYGLISVISSIAYGFLYWPTHFKAGWNFIYTEGHGFNDNGFSHREVIFFLMVGLTLLGILNDFAIWKRIQFVFLPAVYAQAVGMGVNLIMGPLDIYKLHKGIIQPNSIFLFLLKQVLWSDYLIPAFYLGIAWVFYRGEMFKSVQIKKDPALPNFMNRSTIYVWINGIFAGSYIIGLVVQIHWVFWGQKS